MCAGVCKKRKKLRRKGRKKARRESKQRIGERRADAISKKERKVT